jgi:hypothetical protein
MVFEVLKMLWPEWCVLKWQRRRIPLLRSKCSCNGIPNIYQSKDYDMMIRLTEFRTSGHHGTWNFRGGVKNFLAMSIILHLSHDLSRMMEKTCSSSPLLTFSFMSLSSFLPSSLLLFQPFHLAILLSLWLNLYPVACKFATCICIKWILK